MAIWLNAWVGDHAGTVTGRQNNQLLVSLSYSDFTIPSGLFQFAEDDGTPDYYRIVVSCLTPNSRPARVIKAVPREVNVWSLDLAQVDYTDSGWEPWAAGVHLFSVDLDVPNGAAASTIATAVIDDAIPVIEVPPAVGNHGSHGWFPWAGMQMHRRPGPRR
jgi:hypothetical protein